MEKRKLGVTDLELTPLSFGASSLGQEFRSVTLDEALRSVHVALECGMNFIDTSPFYGRGMSEVLLGQALKDVPRDSYYLGTKLGRYDLNHFDFSAKRVQESIDVSLHRLGTDHLDIVLCHDIEFIWPLDQIIEETIPALRRQQQLGKVRYVGISGYPMKIFQHVLERTSLDCVLSYNHYCLQNTQFGDLVPFLQQHQCGIMNAAPFCARLLTNAPLPEWHRATPEVRQTVRKAADLCTANGVDIAQLALQFSLANPDMTTCVSGSANPQRIAQWAEWAQQPLDESLLADVREILAPVHNWHHIEGCPSNNDGVDDDRN